MTVDNREQHRRAITYIRQKVDQLLALMGTLPLRHEELDDATLIELDPIGIIAGSFAQVLAHVNATNHELQVARDETRTILDAMGAAVVVLNPDLTIDECNRQALHWFLGGSDPAAVRGRPLSETCCCGARVEMALLESGAPDGDFELNGRRYHVVCSEIANKSGQPPKRVFLYFDVTRQKEAEARLRLYAQVFNSTAEGIALISPDHRIVEVNDAFCRITGYPAEELRGRTPRLLQSGLHDAAFYAGMWSQIDATDHWQGEIIDRARDGRLMPLLQTISAVRNADGTVSHYITLISDISPLKETQSRLDYLAHHDLLTGLPNRLLFSDRLDHAIERAARDGATFAVLYIDLDRFKTINDSLGHHIGDKVLVEAGERLKRLVRKFDTVARLGGDEFVLLLENLPLHNEVTQQADKVVDELRQPFIINDVSLHVGCSVGITVYPEDGTDAVSLLKNADAAMYKVKELGRDGYFKFSHDLSSAVLAKLTLENALRLAVKQEQFVLHYQPIIDLGRRRTIAAEALLRWLQPGDAPILPDHFIPVAEETRLIIPLGRWVARQAIAQFRQWQEQGLVLDYVSINVSAAQIFHCGFADELIGLLDEYRMAGRCLQVELTENVLMHDIKTCQRVLARLRERGVRVAIDDFGSGYSSLSYLKQLPIDNLKIDRAFVRDIPGDPNDCAIAAAVIGLARTLGLEAVAEGVETRQQEDYLRQVGCHTVQGNHYARPLGADEFQALLAASLTVGD